VLGVLLMVACTGPEADDSAGSADTWPQTDTAPPEGFEVSGTVLGLLGEPVVDVFVTVSTEFCIPDQTDAEGRFTVGQVAEGPKRLITYGDTATNGLFASVVFAFDAEGPLVFDGPVLAPELTEIWPLDPTAAEAQTIETADGLTLTVAAGAVTLAPFAPDELQVARVPVAQAPAFVPDGVALVDLFALHPIQSTLDPPARTSFPADTGLAPGAAVTFHSLDYDTGLLVPVATGTVDADGHPTTDTDQGIPELTWIGLSAESP